VCRGDEGRERGAVWSCAAEWEVGGGGGGAGAGQAGDAVTTRTERD